jgi:hypothetical protein
VIAPRHDPDRPYHSTSPLSTGDAATDHLHGHPRSARLAGIAKGGASLQMPAGAMGSRGLGDRHDRPCRLLWLAPNEVTTDFSFNEEEHRAASMLLEKERLRPADDRRFDLIKHLVDMIIHACR